MCNVANRWVRSGFAPDIESYEVRYTLQDFNYVTFKNPLFRLLASFQQLHNPIISPLDH